jgi:hypothetical protein
MPLLDPNAADLGNYIGQFVDSDHSVLTQIERLMEI